MVKGYDPKKYSQLPNKTYDTLSLQEIVCQVCERLAYPPVTLPCNHLFCNECYEKVKQTGTLICPSCRARFNVFDRRRKSNVVNVNLQEAILRFFPEKVELKISGQDDGIADELRERDLAESRRISVPGEVHNEYLLALEEVNREREQEQIASEKCAEDIQEQEEKIAIELQKREEEDAEVAMTVLQQEEEEYHQVRQEKEKRENLDMELALALLKEQGEPRVPLSRITQRSLDSYFAIGRSVASAIVPSAGPGGEEPILVPSCSVNTEEMEPWLREIYLQEQIERDHLLALQVQQEIDVEMRNAEKKRVRVQDYSLRNSSKKKKSDN